MSKLTVGEVRKIVADYKDDEPWPFQPLLIPPRPLVDQSPPPVAPLSACDDCEASVVPGVIWDRYQVREPGEELGVMTVERCDTCARYASDELAARAVVAAIVPQLEAVFLADRPWDIAPADLGNGFGRFGVRPKPPEPGAPPVPRCLYCGETEVEKIRYVEDSTTYRDLIGDDGAGVLQIYGHYDDDGDGTNPRFSCMTCGRESPIPDDLTYDFD